MQRLKSRILTFIALLLLIPTLVLGIQIFSPVVAQFSLPQTLESTLPDLFTSESDEETEILWIRLDGKPLFRIAGLEDELPERVREVQQNLEEIQKNYLDRPDRELDIEIKTKQSLPTIYINDRYLLTATHLDARLQGSEMETYTETLKTSLREGLKASRAERQPPQRRKQTRRAIVIFVVLVTVSLLLNILPIAPEGSPSTSANTDAPPIATRLNLKQNRNLRAIRRILRQLSQVILWTAGILLILSLFPQTRILQVIFLDRLRTYLIVGAIFLVTYILVRLSYVLIDRAISTFIESTELIPQKGFQRLQQRVSTISSVTKSISTILLSIVAILLALISLGINIAPLLAGAGLIGVAISLASQNLIKDAINGFLILAEDQYAVGDVIVVGDVFGLVENISLRITQLRDTEQRLITIPNSEIKIVSNLSSRRSQADIKIPFSYGVDIDRALVLVEKVGEDLARDPDWQEFILEQPQVLGLDEFTARAAIVRVWIATQPLKQWEVGREFRRRIKRACDRAEMPLSLGREEIWLQAEKEVGDRRVKLNHSS